MEVWICGQLMTDGCSKLKHKYLKLNFCWLIILIFSVACQPNKNNNNVNVIYDGEQAVSISILLPDSLARQKDLQKILSIHLAENSASIIGKYNHQKNLLYFKPHIPFRPSHQYEIRVANKLYKRFDIRPNENVSIPTVAIYPSSDTIPDNLLKMYLHFSQPMQEPRPLKNIFVFSENGDTLSNVFLDLQPPLWNVKGDRLTLWLDPGRIKRDLIPNKKMGAPFISGNKVTLQVNSTFKSITGQPLKNHGEKTYYITNSDRKSPVVKDWHIDTPDIGSKTPLDIQFHETLDYGLISASFQIISDNGDEFTGQFKSWPNEVGLSFYPDNAWVQGTYLIKVDTKLEDLAGNNLNRLFDVDLANDNETKNVSYLNIPFEIKQSEI